MSLIGDYIHFHVENYIKYGVERSSSNAAFNWEKNDQGTYARVTQLLRTNNPTIDNEKANAIAEKLTTVLATKDKSTLGEDLIVWNYIQDSFEKMYGTVNSTITSTGGVEIKKVSEALEKIPQLGKNKTDRRQLHALKSRIEKSYSNLRKIKKQQTMSNKQYNQIHKELTNLNKIIHDLEVDAQKLGLKQVEIPKNLESRLNLLFKVLDANAAIAEQIGQVGEFSVEAIMATVEGLAIKSIDEAVDIFDEQGVYKTGQSVAARQLDSSKFISEFSSQDTQFNVRRQDKKTKKWKTVTITGQELVSEVYQTENKVDIFANFGGGTTAGISVKSYDLTNPRKITLVTGTSLLRLLQDQDPNLVNHYLNIISQTKQSALKQSLGEHVTWTRRCIKAIVLFKALSGDQTTVLNQADWLVVIDNSTGKVSIVSINSLIEQITKTAESIDAFKSSNITQQHNQPLDTLVLRPNKTMKEMAMQPGENQKRIALLLQQVHNQKIHAALPTSYLSFANPKT